MHDNQILIDAESRIMTIDEGARVLRVKTGTIRNWLSQGRLKKIKLCGKTYLDRLEIEEIIKRALSE